MKTLIYGGRLIDPANRVDGRLNLLIGIFVGSMVLCSGALLAGLNETFYSFIHTFESNSNTIVLASFLLIGALIYLIEKSGGIDGFTEVMLKKRALIKSKRGANLFTWLLGIIIFTSGGVAEGGAISVLLKSIPLNFYCILAVFGTLAVCLFNINIGPMRKAEERAEKTGELDEPGHGGALSDAADKVSDAKPRVINMVLPMCVLIVTILATLTVTGNGNPTQGAGMQSLLWGCVLAVLTICILCVAQKLYTVEGVINEMFKGMGTMLPMAAVLLFGFTMGSLVKSLDTGNYLTAVFMGVLTPALLPMLSFLLCMLLSFATGTSMGTMAIMSVICLPMAINMGVNTELVAGAIFGGSIFGDHCSPISDTTIMSCATSDCDIIDHVKTQIPYAAICAGVSIALYTVLGFVM